MPVQSIIDALRNHAWVGQLECHLQPRRRTAHGGPFHGQHYRRRIAKQLCADIGFDRVIECGAFRGETTGYLHDISRAPVDSLESNARFYGYCRTRYQHNTAVTFHHRDSCTGLRQLLPTTGNVFAYLDAHSKNDPPLREEVETLFVEQENVIAMVDDFQVPGDVGYAYASYGSGKALTGEYLDTTNVSGVRRFYPTLPAERETGNRRGCVVLAKGALADQIASKCHLIAESPAVTATSRAAA